MVFSFMSLMSSSFIKLTFNTSVYFESRSIYHDPHCVHSSSPALAIELLLYHHTIKKMYNSSCGWHNKGSKQYHNFKWNIVGYVLNLWGEFTLTSRNTVIQNLGYKLEQSHILTIWNILPICTVNHFYILMLLLIKLRYWQYQDW